MLIGFFSVPTDIEASHFVFFGEMQKWKQVTKTYSGGRVSATGNGSEVHGDGEGGVER